MNALVPWLQDAVAAAFVVLGLVTAVSWLRSRDRSMGFLALAIILLSAVSGLGRLQAHLPFTIPLLGTLNLLGFAGSGYALLLYRDSLIPLPRRWHAVAIASLAAASVFLIVAQALSVGRTASTIIAVVCELAALAIVPLLYASFAPPTWLRRQWRAPEEEGLRAFMEDLIVNEDRDALAKRALEWATRLVGGAAAVQF